MSLILERFCNHDKMGCFGELKLDDNLLCYTVERPWIPEVDGEKYPAGQPFNSCIPTGLYELKETEHNGKDSLVLINPMLSVFEHDEGYGRYACKVHTANFMSDVEGCIGFGKTLAWAKDRYDIDRWMVTHSGDTTLNIIALLKMRNIDRIKIQWRQP